MSTARGVRAPRSMAAAWPPALGALVAVLAVACGGEVPAGGVPKTPVEAPISRAIAPTEALPADLDLVVRFDLVRLKDALGPRPEEELAARLSTDPVVASALRKARSLTVGLRLADLEEGDHVLVVEGPTDGVVLPGEGLSVVPSANDKVRPRLREGGEPRDGNQLIVVIEGAGTVFASPAETDAVLRVLREGPDDARGRPSAEGLVSLELRPRRLPRSLEQRYPSIGRIVAQITRVRRVLRVAAEGVRVELDVAAKTDAGAERIARFLEALRDGASDEGTSRLLTGLAVERLGTANRVTLTLPSEILLGMLGGARIEATAVEPTR